MSKYNDKFIELQSIGNGAFSTVFEAQSIKDRKKYAIKKIPFSNDEKVKKLNEINFLKTLHSYFVVTCIKWWIEDNYCIDSFDKNKNNISSDNLLYSPNKPFLLHIQMELCSLSLKDFINQIEITKPNSLTIEQYFSNCDLFSQLLECVNYLHQQNPPIIHRDLKPENVLLFTTKQNSYKVKLADFGLSTYHKYNDESHSSGVGTIGYMAPEVVNKKPYDTKADIYSLGKIMEQLFNFDLNRDDIDINSEILLKYKTVKRICLDCVSYTTKLRPDCHRIINFKHLWIFRIEDTKCNLGNMSGNYKELSSVNRFDKSKSSAYSYCLALSESGNLIGCDHNITG